MPKISVIPGNKTIEVANGANLRLSLIEAGIEVKSPCGGCASCGQCIVVITEGKENLSDVSFEEKQLIGNVEHITSERLSCQTKVLGDVGVDVSIHMQPVKPKKVVRRRTAEESKAIIEDRKANARPEREGGFSKPKALKPMKENTYKEKK